MNLFSSKAFTLIELLVVVAVIAILAAIAVPNFLEAQTRSKVSRAKSDMRTIATGLESYVIDQNRYPPDFQSGVVTFLGRLEYITTPISYLSSVPGDPFANIGAIDAHIMTTVLNPYAENGVIGNDYIYPLTYDYAKRINDDGSVEGASTWDNIASNYRSTFWALKSNGPDLTPDFLGSNPAPYDSTNGTVSEGNIFWTGPGIGEDYPRNMP